MKLKEFWRHKKGRPSAPPPQRRLRPAPEPLEGRALLAVFTASSVAALIADIKAANQAGGPNTITLAPGKTFLLTTADNTTDGATGLPVIAANDQLIIIGNGDAVERSTAKGTPAFRLFDVAVGASLTLGGLTLQGGLASGGNEKAEGGAVINRGTLTLDGVSVRENIAQGRSAAIIAAAGGGIYSTGKLTLKGGTTLQNNHAFGSQGDPGWTDHTGFNNSPTAGGDAAGGGVYVSGGTADFTNVTLSDNTAQGGQGGDMGKQDRQHPRDGGDGIGGGVYVSGGTADFTNVTLSDNTAQGGQGGDMGKQDRQHPRDGGDGIGGGLYVSGGTADFTNVTLSDNTAQGGQGGSGITDTGSIRFQGGQGGNGSGGGIYAGGGISTLRNVKATGNFALSGLGGPGTSPGISGTGEGGGIFIDPVVSVSLDSITVANVIKNKASTKDPNIHGSYVLYI